MEYFNSDIVEVAVAMVLDPVAEEFSPYYPEPDASGVAEFRRACELEACGRLVTRSLYAYTDTLDPAEAPAGAFQILVHDADWNEQLGKLKKLFADIPDSYYKVYLERLHHSLKLKTKQRS